MKHSIGLFALLATLAAFDSLPLPGAESAMISFASSNAAPVFSAASQKPLKVHVSWGHQTKDPQPFFIKLIPTNAIVAAVSPVGFESADATNGLEYRTSAGGGDVDGLDITLVCPTQEITERKDLHSIWRYLLDHADADTAQRLHADAACRQDLCQLTIQMNEEGTRGFSLTTDQLLRQKTFWVPDLDIFVSAADPPVSFADHMASLAPWRGKRLLDQVARKPEASYEQFTARWEDMGSPAYQNPHSTGPGHIVGLTWDSAIPKFGIDRGAVVRNDYGNPHHFLFAIQPLVCRTLPPATGNTANNSPQWKGQQLTNGLPLITTFFEQDEVRFEIEQFAYPLHGPPTNRRGDLPMVLLEKVRLVNQSKEPRNVNLQLTLAGPNASVLVHTNGPAWTWNDASDQNVWLALEPTSISGSLKLSLGPQTNVAQAKGWTTNLTTLTIALPASREPCELVFKLPSPAVAPVDLPALTSLDFAKARAETVKFWSDYLAAGAQFSVPEESVNTLFRANLWHALRLPRRHGSAGPDVKIDLPYSNFAYDQQGTPWPVNQAVYVDYMLYDLRGYHAISAEELTAIYRNNQEPNGHVGGFANWGVYTPGMLYSVAQHYLLSGDRASFEALLPRTLKAMDWCLAEMKRAEETPGPAQGLVLAPLNDLSHNTRAWAFNQAYLYAGPALLARALGDIGHPRANECAAAARRMQDAVQRGFACAAVRSPLVQLRDHTWIPYVPCDALTPGRLLNIWYPTDVDTGALHLSRLGALPPESPLTSYLLRDHEDNLFLNGWGMANEPVYNQHATAYLLRDEAPAAIRAFYSMMACAFSHSVFEPVEHRWAWGQYFGPPSTDGAWFELYRRMLIREQDDDTLLLLQATPREWLANGKQIRVERAPTYYGPLSLQTASAAAAGEIHATIEIPSRKKPKAILLRLRHPDQKPIRSVLLNDRAWTDFDPQQEWIRIPTPTEARFSIVARY